MESQEFAGFLSGVASRLRHDLKGGLITLRMGLEALPDEEDLKPHLVERARSLETLSDKLVLLLRMGEMKPSPMRLSALFGEWRGRLATSHPDLQLVLPTGLDVRPAVDSDALLYALGELAENAALAGASKLEVQVESRGDELTLLLEDDGSGPPEADRADPYGALSPLGVSRWGRSGLGLAIADRFARSHGGQLSLSGSSSGGMQARLLLRGTQ